MANQKLEFFKGDSSKQIVVKLFDSEGAQITTLTNYTGWFALVSALGGSPLISRTMTASNGTFVITITPTESQALAVGTYTGVCEIENTVISPAYRQEIHFEVVVNTQGYTAS